MRCRAFHQLIGAVSHHLPGAAGHALKASPAALVHAPEGFHAVMQVGEQHTLKPHESGVSGLHGVVSGEVAVQVCTRGHEGAGLKALQ